MSRESLGSSDELDVFTRQRQGTEVLPFRMGPWVVHGASCGIRVCDLRLPPPRLGEAPLLATPIAPIPCFSNRASSLEIVEHNSVPRSFGKADAVLTLVVQVVLVDREKGRVRLAPD